MSWTFYVAKPGVDRPYELVDTLDYYDGYVAPKREGEANLYPTLQREAIEETRKKWQDRFEGFEWDVEHPVEEEERLIFFELARTHFYVTPEKHYGATFNENPGDLENFSGFAEKQAYYLFPPDVRTLPQLLSWARNYFKEGIRTLERTQTDSEADGR